MFLDRPSFLLARLGGHEVVTTSGLSLLAGVGDLMLPAAVAATLAAQVTGVGDRMKVLRLCIVPALLCVVASAPAAADALSDMREIAASRRVPLLVGITDTAFIESVHIARHAADAGAAALVLAPPYYLPEGQPELQEYLDHLANLEHAVANRQQEVMLHELRDLQACMSSCHREFKSGAKNRS
mgnify:CR=1 FL=1